MACEFDSSSRETLAALRNQLGDLRDCLKAGQPTARLLTQTIAMADRAAQQIHVSHLFYSLLVDDSDFSVATHRYAETLLKLRKIQAKNDGALASRGYACTSDRDIGLQLISRQFYIARWARWSTTWKHISGVSSGDRKS